MLGSDFYFLLILHNKCRCTIYNDLTIFFAILISFHFLFHSISLSTLTILITDDEEEEKEVNCYKNLELVTQIMIMSSNDTVEHRITFFIN